MTSYNFFQCIYAIRTTTKVHFCNVSQIKCGWGGDEIDFLGTFPRPRLLQRFIMLSYPVLMVNLYLVIESPTNHKENMSMQLIPN